jgi:hypothetical protein
VGNPITLTSTAEAAKSSSQLMRVAEEAIRSLHTFRTQLPLFRKKKTWRTFMQPDPDPQGVKEQK